MEIFNGYGALLVVLIGLSPIAGYTLYYLAIAKKKKYKVRLAKKVARKLASAAALGLSGTEEALPRTESVAEPKAEYKAKRVREYYNAYYSLDSLNRKQLEELLRKIERGLPLSDEEKSLI